MGNSALACIRGKGQVRVILSDGNVVEFKRPVTASTVMRRYPHHLVLHCSMASSLGQRRRIAVVKPEQVLRSKQNYLVMPVQSTSNAKTFIDAWAFFALNASNVKFNSRLNPNHKPRYSQTKRRWIHDILAKIFRFSQGYVETEDESRKPLLSQGYKQPSSPSKASAGSCFQNWKPSLDCIPESAGTSPSPDRYRNSKYRPAEMH